MKQNSCQVPAAFQLPKTFPLTLCSVKMCLSSINFFEVDYEPAAVHSIPAHVTLKKGFLSWNISPREKWYLASVQEGEHFLLPSGLEYRPERLWNFLG